MTHTESKPSRWLSYLILPCIALLLCAEAFLGYRLHALSAEQEQIKADYSLSNNITFGIFSVDQWRDRLSAIVNGQVSDYHLGTAQKKALRTQVEQQLHGLINKTIHSIDQPQKSLGGKLKKLAFHSMVDAKDLHAQVPSFAKTIVDRVSSPASQARLKHIVTGKLTQLEQQTYDSTSVANFAITQYLYKKYRVSDPQGYNREINKRLATIRQVTFNYAYAMLGCVLAALALGLLLRRQSQLHGALFTLSLLFALVLLLTGITTSVIEVDARMQALHFSLLDQQVAFENQVLFFQSKSLAGITETLIRQSKPDAVTVGILILLFVIILPLLRMLARGAHVLSPGRLAKNKAVNYLAFESAKWDMADVMVVGILMTYIGLNGILKSQLSGLNIHNGSLSTATANNTSLQPGYFIFTGHVVLTVILAYLLSRRRPPLKASP